jgi:hypothetical protein
MLSETCKFNLFAVLSHQTLDQVPDRMRSGLQHVEVDITFRTGRGFLVGLCGVVPRTFSR